MRILSLLILLGTFFISPSYAIQSLDQIVGTVDNEVITRNELQDRLTAWKRQMEIQGQAIPAKGSKDEVALKKQVFNSLIEERLQMVAAENYGIEIEDQDLNQTLVSIAKQNNMDLETFKQTLEADGYSYPKFQEDLRRDLLLNRLQQQLVNSRIQISEEEVDEFLKNSKHLLTANQEYRVGHILIGLPENPTGEELRSAQRKVDKIMHDLNQGVPFAEMATKYSTSGTARNGGDLGWLKEGELPTLFMSTVPKMQIGQVAGPVRNGSGLHVIKLMEVRSEDAKQEVQQSHVRHILIKTNEIVNDDEAKLRINELKQRIAQGEEFQALARTHSEDPGSATKGGDLGWVDANSNLDESFFKAMQNTSTGQVSAPFKSAFGWHIVQVVERRQQDQTVEFQRKMAQRMLQSSKFPEERQKWINELRDMSVIDIKDAQLKDS